MKRTRTLMAMCLVLGAVVLVTACAGPTSTTPPASSSSASTTASVPVNPTTPDAAGVMWVLTGSSLSSQDLGKVRITARFDNNTIFGFGGLNTYSAPCELGADGSLKVGAIVTSKRSGPDFLMNGENAYLKLLAGCNSYVIADSTLTLRTNGADTLIYKAEKAKQLQGTKWEIMKYNDPSSTVVSPLPGSSLTLDFNADGTLAGNGGVNTFTGTYQAGIGTVTVGPLTATRQSGSPELMAQEAAFLNALGSCIKWEIVGGYLQMRDADGSLQLSAKAR